ncbi:MAG: XRE family transcriptional regulator [Marinirhabdus sp.]
MEKQLSVAARRFKKVRQEQGHTQHSFAKLLQIGNTTADIERGKTKLSGKAVMQLLRLYNINPLWLFGKGFTKYLNVLNGDVSPKVVTVNPEKKEAIILVNQKAAAGYPQNIGDPEWYGALPAFHIPLPQYRNATYRGFQVEGDSMLPNIRPNEWVLGKAVPNITEAPDGKIYIVVMRSSVLVKKLQKTPNMPNRVKLISLNPDYPPIPVKMRDVQELWMVNSKLTFGLDGPSENSLLRQLQQSMHELKEQVRNLRT